MSTQKTKRQEYIEILLEEKFNSDEILSRETDLALLNSLSTEQLKQMVLGQEDLEEFEE